MIQSFIAKNNTYLERKSVCKVKGSTRFKQFCHKEVLATAAVPS